MIRRTFPVAVVMFAVLCAGVTTAAPNLARAQSRVEQGENAWLAGMAFAAQGNADSALAAFARAETVGRSENDSSLLAAALRAQAEVIRTYRACSDSALALLRAAVKVSIQGDRAAPLALARALAARGSVAEARQVHTAAFADIADQVPRTITRETIAFLATQAAIQRAAGQHVAALASLMSARDIAARLIRGDATDSAPPRGAHDIDYLNYWVMFDMAQLRLASTTRGVMSPAEGKALMDAVAKASDKPDEGDQRRFPVFRLADRLVIKAWVCQMNGDRCPAPQPKACVR